MAAGFRRRNWLHTVPLALAILMVGLARQYANAEGVFQSDGLVQTARAAVSHWWDELDLAASAAVAEPTPTAVQNAVPVAVTGESPTFDRFSIEPFGFPAGPHHCPSGGRFGRHDCR